MRGKFMGAIYCKSTEVDLCGRNFSANEMLFAGSCRRLRFDGPWLNFGQILVAPPANCGDVFQLVPITPRMRRETIEAAMAAGWACGHLRDHRLFERSADGALVPVDIPACAADL